MVAIVYVFILPCVRFWFQITAFVVVGSQNYDLNLFLILTLECIFARIYKMTLPFIISVVPVTN